MNLGEMTEDVEQSYGVYTGGLSVGWSIDVSIDRRCVRQCVLRTFFRTQQRTGRRTSPTDGPKNYGRHIDITLSGAIVRANQVLKVERTMASAGAKIYKGSEVHI
jgi:hypothetical protein